nr:hypothetical protein [Candidatus Woesearchaeota archaeon]
MDKNQIVDLIQRIDQEQVSPEQGILLNIECSAPQESVMIPFVKHLAVKGSDQLADRVAEAVARGERSLLFDGIFIDSGLVHDMAISSCLVRDASGHLWSGYRLVSRSPDGKSGLQYAAPNKDELFEVLGSLLIAQQEQHIDSVAYQTIPRLHSATHTSVMHHFDRLPPAVRVAPSSSELIAACAERGWNLYQLRENRIYSKSGPAQHLLVGEKYSIVPTCTDPTSAAHIMAARMHANETGQTFHAVSCSGVPHGFAPSGFSLTRQFLVFEPHENPSKATPYSSFLSCIDSGHWSSYDSTALPSRPKPSIVN